MRIINPLFNAEAPVGIVYNKITALQILRSMRSAGKPARKRTDLFAPSLPACKRWTWGRLSPGRFGGESNPAKIYVAAPSAGERIRNSRVTNTVYGTGLPRNSCVVLAGSTAISGPELLFVEMGALMPPIVQGLLGMELCGTFSRDPINPRLGPITYGVRPVTTVEKIERFLSAATRLRGHDQAERVLRVVRDNAWSPMETVIATMAMTPISDLGYGMGDMTLNFRLDQGAELISLGVPQSRVPDMLFDGTNVGLNYDGRGHLDLDAIASVVPVAEEACDGDAVRQDLSDVIGSIRRKSIEDLRRNRELAAMGYVILPATSEDLFVPYALDALMLEVMLAIERFSQVDMKPQRVALRSKALRGRRQQLVWSLLPWAEAEGFARATAIADRRGFTAATLLDETEFIL